MKNFYFNSCTWSSYYEDIIFDNCLATDKILNNVQITYDMNYSFEKISYSKNGVYLLGLSGNKLLIFYNRKFYNKIILLSDIEKENLKEIQITNNGSILLLFLNNTINVYNYKYYNTNNELINLFNEETKSPLNIITAKLNNSGNHLIVCTSNVSNKNSLYEINTVNNSIKLIPNSLDGLYKDIKEIKYSNNSLISGFICGDKQSKNELRILINKSGNSYIEIDNDFEEINYKSNFNISNDNSNISYITNDGKIKWYILTSTSEGYTRENYELDLKTDLQLIPIKIISVNSNKLLVFTNSKLLLYQIVSNEATKLFENSITFNENNGTMFDILNNYIYFNNNSNEIYRYEINNNSLNKLETGITTYKNYLNFNKYELINGYLHNLESTTTGLFYYIKDFQITYLEFNYISTTIYYNNEVIDSNAYKNIDNKTIIKKEWLRENFPIDYNENIRRYESFLIRKNIISETNDSSFISFRDSEIDIQIVDYNDLLYFNEHNFYVFAGALILDKDYDQTYTIKGIFGNNSMIKEENTVTCSYNNTTKKYKFNYSVFSKKSLSTCEYEYQTITLIKYNKEVFINDSNYDKVDLNKFYENLNNNLIDRMFTDQVKEIDTYKKNTESLFNKTPFKIDYSLEINESDAEKYVFYLIVGNHDTAKLSNGLTKKGNLTVDEKAINRYKVLSSFKRTVNNIEENQEIEHDFLSINELYKVPSYQFSKEPYSVDNTTTPIKEIYDSGISLKIIGMHDKVNTKYINGYNYIDYINEISNKFKETFSFNTEIKKSLEVPNNYITMNNETFPITGEKVSIQINNSGSDIYDNTKLNNNDFLIMNGDYLINTTVENDYIPSIRYLLRDSITFKSLESKKEFEIKKRVLPAKDISYKVEKILVEIENKVLTKFIYTFEKMINQEIEFYSGISLKPLGEEYEFVENDNNYIISCSKLGKNIFLVRTYITGLYNNFNDKEFEFTVEENDVLDINSPIEITPHNNKKGYNDIKYNDVYIKLKSNSFNKLNELTFDSKLKYKGYIENTGWTEYYYDGYTLGSTGQSLKINAISLNLDHQDYKGNIEYNFYQQDIGWSGWKKNDEIINPSKNRGFYGLRIKLSGEINNYFNVYYMCHFSNIGWTEWKKNDEIIDYSKSKNCLEAIKVQLTYKNEDVLNNTYPKNTIIQLKYNDFNGNSKDIFYDRDMPLYLFNNTSISISEKTNSDTSKIYTDELLKSMQNNKPEYTYNLDDIDFSTKPPKPIITISTLDPLNIIKETPVKKYMKNVLLTFNNLNSTEYTSYIYINNEIYNIEKNTLILQNPGTYRVDVSFISNLNYTGNSSYVEFEILNSDQIPPFIEYTNITESNVDVNIRYLLNDRENDFMYDDINIGGTFNYPEHITDVLKEYPPKFMQEINKINNNSEFLLDLNSSDQQMVSIDTNGNYSFTMNANDRLIARRKFMNGQTGEGTIDIDTYVFNDVPDVPEISLQISSKDRSIVFPIIKKQLGCLYEITLNNKPYKEGIPITVSGQVKKEFIIKVIVKYKEDETLTNSNTLKFTIDTIQPLSPIIKISNKTIYNNKIYNINKESFKPIVSNKENGIKYLLNIEGYIFDITNDNYDISLFINSITNYNKPYKMTIYSIKESNNIQIYDSYYFEINNNEITDTYYTSNDTRNIIIPYLEENDVYEYPGELVIDSRTGNFSIVSNEINTEIPEFGYKLNNITENILSSQPKYLFSRNLNYLTFHQEKLNYYKSILINMKNNNDILAELLGKVNKNNRSTGNINFDLDTNLLNEINSLNTKIGTAYTNIILNKIYNLNNTEMSYLESIEYIKTIIKQSSNVSNLVHISTDNTTILFKEKLMSMINQYYELISMYSKCKYNLINLNKETNKKIYKRDFETFKNRQDKYYNNMKDYLSRW